MTAPSPTLPEKKPDGGPAFPNGLVADDVEWTGAENDIKVVNSFQSAHGGMTMRQWYAGMALQGLLACPEPEEFKDHDGRDYVRLAFRYADVMLAVGADHG